MNTGMIPVLSDTTFPKNSGEGTSI